MGKSTTKLSQKYSHEPSSMVAKELCRYYIGCELHEDYGKLIKNRISDARGTLEWFL